MKVSPSRCPSCACVSFEDKGEYHGLHHPFLNLNKYYCSNCSIVFADPMPDQSDLDSYNQEYFLNAHGIINRDVLSDAFFKTIAASRVEYIENTLVESVGSFSTVLEIGPGPGYFAKEWLNRFPSTQYLAVESDVSCHNVLEQFGVNLLKDHKCEFDLLVMSHVLEHVTEPLIFIHRYAENLRDGGAIFIEVPCEDYLFKNVDEPHLLFFNKHSMNILLHKLGFDVVKISYNGKSHRQLLSRSWVSNFIERVKLKYLSIRYANGNQDINLSTLENKLSGIHHIRRESQEPCWWLRVLAIKRTNSI
jgi:SAM-dependent methyltransferase